jgi:hypothetical protein
MKSDLDTLQLTDKEKIAFLEKRHESIIKWLNSRIEEAKKEIIPEPHPLDFALSTEEEKENRLNEISFTNRRAGCVISQSEYTLIAIENGTKSMIARLYKEKFPSNGYEI